MTRIVLDPDEVNQDRVVTLTDGTTVELDGLSRRELDRVARQLHVHRSSYAHAYVALDPVQQDRVAADEVRVEDVGPLYLRVAELQRRAREGRGARAAAELDLTLLFQTRRWVSSSGAEHVLVEMTPTHRRNLLGWLERQSDALEARVATEGVDTPWLVAADPWIAGTPLHRRLTELVAAESGREEAIDRARQVVRRVSFDETGQWPDR